MNKHYRIGLESLTKLVAGAAAVCLLASLALADDKDKDPLLALAQARAKAEIAVRALEPMADDAKSGWGPAWNRLNVVYVEAYQTLDAATAEENKKPAESRNQAFVEECGKRRNTIVSVQWPTFSGQEGPLMNSRFTDVRNGYSYLRGAFDQASALEQYLKNAKADAAPLKAVYENMEKRAVELQELSKQTIEEIQYKLKVWEAELSTVKGFTGQSGADKSK